MSRFLTVLALLLTLTGCGIVPEGTAEQQEATYQANRALPESAIVPAPVAVDIPAIGAASSLIPLGLNPDGTLAVPPVTEPAQASWFEPGVIPGEVGPAIVAGHVSGRPPGATSSVPGVFARLAELGPGDEILVSRTGAAPLRFVVARVETHDKDDFPTDAVYGDRAGPELVLITCGGALDPTARSYDSNVLVFAVLT